MKRSYQQDERKRRLMWKSYVLQEAEACAREAKMAWATREGIRVMNLQHDGIVTGSLGGRQSQEVARGMQEAASHASGHEVQVKGELIWCEAGSGGRASSVRATQRDFSALRSLPSTSWKIWRICG